MLIGQTLAASLAQSALSVSSSKSSLLLSLEFLSVARLSFSDISNIAGQTIAHAPQLMHFFLSWMIFIIPGQ